jgi:hypothetical protein
MFICSYELEMGSKPNYRPKPRFRSLTCDIFTEYVNVTKRSASRTLEANLTSESGGGGDRNLKEAI